VEGTLRELCLSQPPAISWSPRGELLRASEHQLHQMQSPVGDRTSRPVDAAAAPPPIGHVAGAPLPQAQVVGLRGAPADAVSASEVVRAEDELGGLRVSPDGAHAGDAGAVSGPLTTT